MRKRQKKTIVAAIDNYVMKLLQWSDLIEIKEFQFVCIIAHNDIFRRIY
jgi:hypothetical protein